MDQLYGWMAAFTLMPWGDEWLRDAVLMAQTYNANRPKGKPPLKPWDFMPIEQRPQSQDEMWRVLQQVRT
ncbi:MAG: phage tail assembly protein T [Ilumatobacteraceae bacterium]